MSIARRILLLLSLAAPAAFAAEDLARFVPREGIIAYIEHKGFDQAADGWKATAASKALNETGLGALLSDMLDQTAAEMLRLGQAAGAGEAKITPEEYRAILTAAARSGFVAAVTKDEEADAPSFILTIGGAGAGPAREAIDAILGRFDDEVDIVEKQIEGRSVKEIGSHRVWFEEDAAVLVGQMDGSPAFLGPEVQQGAIARRAGLFAKRGGMTPFLGAFIDRSGLPPLPPEAKTLGVDQLKGAELTFGFDGGAIAARAKLALDEQADKEVGVFALLRQPALGRDELPPIPASIKHFSIASAEPGAMLRTALGLVEKFHPDDVDKAREALAKFEEKAGVSIEKDLLDAIGPQFASFVLPAESGDALNMVMYNIPKAVVVAKVKDEAKLKATLEKLAKAANAALVKVDGPLLTQGGRRPMPAVNAPVAAVRMQFRPLPGQEVGQILTIPPAAFPAPAGLKPTFLIQGGYLAIAPTPEAARQALAPSKDPKASWFADPEHAALMKPLPERFGLLSVSDPRDSIPEILVNLPAIVQAIGALSSASNVDGSAPFTLRVDPEKIPSALSIRERLFPNTIVGYLEPGGAVLEARVSLPGFGSGIDGSASSTAVMVALFLPAIQAAREAARRAQAVNNLKQIGLAMHNYHNANGTFPPRAICDKEGKPLLSWRVAILPYIEQVALYEQFKLDEPWDSPHNLKLAEQYMPLIYTDPSEVLTAKETPFQVFAGKGAMFGEADNEGTGIGQITDGTSNTILVAEARRMVPWTKPEDIPFDREADVPPLGGRHPGGANVLFGDGSVRFIKETIAPDVLKALITRDGGEVVSADSF